MVLGGLTGDATVTPMLMDKLVWNEIKLQGCFTADNDATEAALRIIEETKFPVQQMVSHVFPLKDIEHCIRAIGGEVPGTFPTKALINPALGGGEWSDEVLESWNVASEDFRRSSQTLHYSITPILLRDLDLDDCRAERQGCHRHRRRARHRQGLLPRICESRRQCRDCRYRSGFRRARGHGDR